LVFLEKRCLNESVAVVVKSNRMKEELNELYQIPTKKITVVRGGIDLTDFKGKNDNKKENIRKNLSIKKSDKIILFAGRIVPVKGLYYLLIAFAELRKEQPNIRLIIAGRSQMSHYDRVIQEIVNRYNLKDSVIFVGYIPQKEIYKYYDVCDIVVVPSTYEPFGMVNIQAMAMGKLLITTDVAGSVEIIKDYPLLEIIPSFNVEKIRKSIANMLFSDKNIGSFNAKKLLETISWVEMVNNLEELFQNQLNEIS